MAAVNDDRQSVTAFYDDLADDYHLIFADWQCAVRWQGAILHNVVRNQWGEQARTVLDCSCGIGTQAIGLALQGFTVTATDISPRAITRAQGEAAGFGVAVHFAVADMRSLGSLDGTFDLVVSCDNALPHLITDADLKAAISAIRAKINPGGGVLLSIRDYDRLASERPPSIPVKVVERADGRTITFQLWRWADDGSTYTVEQFIMNEHTAGWRTTQAATTYRVLQRDEVSTILYAAGFEDVCWLMPKESGYYQPIVTASVAHP